MNIGDMVSTPRFRNVPISRIFDSVEEAREEGFLVPTYYNEPTGFKVLGRSLGLNRMDFCAACVNN